MVLVGSFDDCASRSTCVRDWPAEVEFILSALEMAQHDWSERRLVSRQPYRARATLKLFSDDAEVEPRELFTRDVGARGMGFITRHRLPLGYGGTLEIAGAGARHLEISCTILRCRQTIQGWFEGAVNFNREQDFFQSDTL